MHEDELREQLVLAHETGARLAGRAKRAEEDLRDLGAMYPRTAGPQLGVPSLQDICAGIEFRESALLIELGWRVYNEAIEDAAAKCDAIAAEHRMFIRSDVASTRTDRLEAEKAEECARAVRALRKV